jgi:hypothetical protein
MRSGISLSKDHLIQLIKRDLNIDFNNSQYLRPKYTDDGYEIFYDYTDEVKLNRLFEDLNSFRNREKDRFNKK